MEFDDTPYQVQQIQARSRDQKVSAVDRDQIEKQRLAQRHECFQRYPQYDDLVKPDPKASYAINDAERFNRDYIADQKSQKQAAYNMTWKRAAHRQKQQEEYEKAIEARRIQEAEDEKKRSEVNGKHDLNEESVLYNPVTNAAPDTTTERGTMLMTQDTQKTMRREARAKRIYHASNSNQYNPITGELRENW